MSCKSKKQPFVERSNSEAEYRSMAYGPCDLLCLRILENIIKRMGGLSKENQCSTL